VPSRITSEQPGDLRSRISRLLEQNKQSNDRLAIHWQKLTYREDGDENFEEQQKQCVIEGALEACLELRDKEIEERKGRARRTSQQLIINNLGQGEFKHPLIYEDNYEGLQSADFINHYP
jgi:hypothetical protein